jgi:hypothetical protein
MQQVDRRESGKFSNPVLRQELAEVIHLDGEPTGEFEHLGLGSGITVDGKSALVAFLLYGSAYHRVATEFVAAGEFDFNGGFGAATLNEFVGLFCTAKELTFRICQ